MGCGGLEKVIVNLINNSSDQFEHSIITLTPDHEMVGLINRDIAVYSLDKKPGKDLGCHLRLFRLLRQIKADAINTYNFGTIEYHVMAFLASVPLRVHSDHGHGGDAADGLNKKNNFIRRIASFFVNDYIVVSKDLRDWVSNTVKIKPNRLHLIQNGVVVEDDVPLQSEPKKTLCTVGRLDAVKNQTLLIEAFADVAASASGNDLKLKIIGDGPERAKLESLARELNLESKIDFMGYREDIREQLLTSDIFILTSHYEAMPMTILEAMALKIPVVTTDVGGIRHFIGDDSVSFVPAGGKQELVEKIIKYTAKSDVLVERVENAYTLVKSKYSIEAMCANYEEIYGR